MTRFFLYNVNHENDLGDFNLRILWEMLFHNWNYADFFLIWEDFIPVDIVCEVKVVFSVSIRHQRARGHMSCAENLKEKNCELLKLPSLL